MVRMSPWLYQVGSMKSHRSSAEGKQCGDGNREKFEGDTLLALRTKKALWGRNMNEV